MNHFNLKSLAFYGIAIGSVLLLFKTVSAYGETNLKAPPAINNRYRLTLADDIPNCEKPDALILNLQQSGIYFNASFLPANTDAEIATSNPKNDSLSGILRNKELSLSGKIDRSLLCNIASTQNALVHLATMQMQLVEQGNFTGQLTLRGSTRNFRFTAVPQKAQEKSQQLKKH
ncbi:hypothetical protein BV372_32020 [Nostoc sp. T09]|uniref:hypothetical protein n=1 Tax=Nostoc sp. T09 TaxID=1932621 RepID=UPI000A361296|nr:hypothetical protein [Nostoc sp. T09]OUL21182.1 hypothetical protein BV372_32020 [Nostoc sp. T09]